MKKEILSTKSELMNTLREVGYKTSKVAVEVYGKLFYMTEAEVRALQVMAKRKAEQSDEAFKEFTDNIIVYSAGTKRRSKHTMVFRKDGCFANDFEPGFMDVNEKLAMIVL